MTPLKTRPLRCHTTLAQSTAASYSTTRRRHCRGIPPPVPLSAPYVPRGPGAHTAVAPAQYWPAGHGTPLPPVDCAGQYDPGGAKHGEHAVAPAKENWPAGHTLPYGDRELALQKKPATHRDTDSPHVASELWFVDLTALQYNPHGKRCALSKRQPRAEPSSVKYPLPLFISSAFALSPTAHGWGFLTADYAWKYQQQARQDMQQHVRCELS